jgi:hypothetical protein
VSRSHSYRHSSPWSFLESAYPEPAVVAAREHFDGAVVQIAAGTDTRRYFLEADMEMFETVVQERLLRGIVDFLNDHDIDVDEAKNFQQIINNGNVYSGNFDFRNSKGSSISGAIKNTNSSNANSSPSQTSHTH